MDRIQDAVLNGFADLQKYVAPGILPLSSCALSLTLLPEAQVSEVGQRGQLGYIVRMSVTRVAADDS